MRVPYGIRRPLFFLFTVLVLAVPALAGENAAYFSPDRVDLTILLAPPPPAGSPAAQADIDVLLGLQQTRTPEQEAAALADRERSVFRFADVLGPGFDDKTLADTIPFFKRVQATGEQAVDKAKRHWNRPRPFAACNDLHPSLPRPQSASYPSGHSVFGHLMAIVLSAMAPEKAPELFARGEAFARQRLIGGVHYPTDVEGGKIAAAVVASALFQDPAFQRDFALAKAKVRAALRLP